jgi:two-component system cell cycle response regulator
MKEAILLVEDNAELLETIASELMDQYNVFTAFNGKEALDILKTEVVHLVVSDVMMPEMDGFEFCSMIKSNVEYSHVPVILLTAKNTLKSQIKGLELGADAYIKKPFDIEHLTVQIASLLTNRKKIREHFASSPLAQIHSIAYTKADETFLKRLNDVINGHLDDPELDVEKLAALMNMSRTTLFRKIKALSDLSAKDFININRLKKAAELLAKGAYTAFEVSIMVGYNSQSHFGRSFHNYYGLTPTEYQKRKQKEG